jgi:hypothetical protein
MYFVGQPCRYSERPSERDPQGAIRTDLFCGLTVFSAVLSYGCLNRWCCMRWGRVVFSDYR